MSYKAALPSTWVGTEEHLRKVTRSVNQLIEAIDLRGDITLTTGSVLIEDIRIGEDGLVLLQPKDAGAAVTTWYAEIANGQVEIFYVGGTGGDFRYQIIL